MRAVNTVSLNGNAWQIESEGYEALATYLKSAETRLKGDPDRDEILADLEQAIADKLAHRVGAHKNVVTAEEITLALQEMGPVESGTASGPGADAGAHGAAAADPGPGAGPVGGAQGSQAPGYVPDAGGAARHLFRIREGGMLGGVCNGLAAYLGIDVTPVRAIFALFSLFTGGIGVVVYLVMLIVVPLAVTAEQMAAAHGKPFSAEELIGRPLGAQSAFAAGSHWRQQWRDQRRMWREQRRQWRRQRRGWIGPTAGPPPPPPPPPYGWHGAPYPGHYGSPTGFGPVSAVLQILLLIVFLTALMGAVSGRPLMGWDWAMVVPNWVGIVAVCMIYGTLVRQVRIARYYGHVGAYHPGHALLALIGTLVWLMILVSVGWYVVHHWPEVQDFLQRALLAIQSLFDDGPAHPTVTT